MPRPTVTDALNVYARNTTHVMLRYTIYTRPSKPRPRLRTRHRGAVVSGVHRMNEVNTRRVRLVLGWVTVFGLVYHLGM